jgi:tRNA(Ile)-lysidine synthase
MNLPDLPYTYDKILVGFSGGADSTALLTALTQKYPTQTQAVHFNHQLRPESEREEEWCNNFCRKRQIKLTIYKLDVLNHQKPAEATEEAARRLRLEKWSSLADQSSTIIALAHHKDDINENFFIRLMRGSGLKGLTGLRPLSKVKKVTFWRPLLGQSKRQLIDFLHENNITDWCEDLSNKRNDYRRNKIRNQLLPLYTEIAGGTHSLENAIKVLTEEADFLDQTAKIHFEKIKEDGSLSSWSSVPTAVLARVLTRFVKFEKDCHFIPTIATVERVVDELESATYKEKLLPLNDELTLIVSKNGVKFAEDVLQEKKLTWLPSDGSEINFGNQYFTAEIVPEVGNAGTNCQYFDLEKLNTPVTIRHFHDGDRIKTFSGLTKKVKKIFSDKKIPKSKRQDIAIFESADKILWVSGLTRSNLAVVTDKTTQILKITLETR